MRALAYLEWCFVRNNLRAIARSPGRLTLWIVYAFSLVLFAVARFARARPHPGGPVLGISHGAALAVAGTLLVFTGIAIAAAAAGRFSAFRSPAEAVLFSNAGLRPRTIALWLTLRRILAGWTRQIPSFVYTFIVFVPIHAGALATARAFVATICVLAVPQGAALPAYLLARGRGRIPTIVAGSVLAAVGAIYAVAGLGGPHVWIPILRTTHVDIAALTRAALLAEPIAFAVPVLLFVAFALVVWLLGNDALPEIYAASNAALARRRRFRHATNGTPQERSSAAVRSANVPPGARAIVWKEWTALRRNSGALALWLAGALVWIACGAAGAIVSLRFHDASTLATLGLAVALCIVFWAPLTAATGLAAELTKPLFWLSTVALRTRIAAWAFARAWRGSSAVGLGVAAAALALREPGFALLALPLLGVAYWSFNALGIGFFAVFPNPLDARGPTALLRFAASAAYLVPAGLAALIAGLLHVGPTGIALTYACALGIQGWLVIELVALRFTEYGASLATMERA
jgi:hypothetical protein